MNDTTQTAGPASWRIILAFLLDLVTAFLVLGFAVASVTGDRTEGGFQLNGLPAVVLFGLIIAYFIVFNSFLGGTIWKRILKAQR